MKINGVDLQYQTQPENAMLEMTHPEWQLKPDIIRDYGCLLIAKLNASNIFFKTFTSVEALNNEVKRQNGYEYLYWKKELKDDMVKVKEKCYQRESYQIHEVVNFILKIKKQKDVLFSEIGINKPEKFYIIKTKFQNTGHYSLILNSKLDYFDSYDGKVKPFIKDKCLKITELTF